MHSPTDLLAALNFVTQRIEAEASLEGEPLSDDELSLLHNLPTESLIDVSPSPDAPGSFPVILGTSDCVQLQERPIELTCQCTPNGRRLGSLPLPYQNCTDIL